MHIFVNSEEIGRKMKNIEYSKKLNDIFEELKNEEVKMVSFDIFDTLLVRPCLIPTDVFYLVERKIGGNTGFAELRKKAEAYARKIKPYYYDDITIDEIYKVLSEIGGFSKDEAEEIKKIEIETERNLLYPKETIKHMYSELLKMGKIVIITSDMYLPRSVLEEILSKNGIDGYERLYVSCEERLAKGSGRLFEKIISDYSEKGIEAKNIAHLGDNYRADVEIPAKMGMKSYHLPKPSGILNSKRYMKSLYRFSEGKDDSFLVGILANYLFDDPYRPYNSDTISAGDYKNLGAVLYGPILLSYTLWLLKEIETKKIDKLLLAYRDGYIFEKIFTIIKGYLKIPVYEDLYLSRSVRYKYYSQEKYGLLSSMRKHPVPSQTTILDFINNRLLVTDKEKVNQIWMLFCELGYENIYSQLGNEMHYFKILPKLNEYFIDSTKDDINIISDYCIKKIGNAERVGIVDVGYQGSVGEFYKKYFGIDTYSFQLFETSNLTIDKKICNNISSFLGYSIETVGKLKILHPLTEDIISKQEGTAINIKIKNGGFFIEKSDFKGIDNSLQLMQDGVLEFVDYAVRCLGNYFSMLNFDRYLYFDMLVEFLSNPNVIDAKLIAKLSFEDSGFISNKKNDIYGEWFKSFGFECEQKKSAIPQPAEKKAVIQEATPISVEKIIPIQETNNMINPKGDEQIPKVMQISKIHLVAIKICEKLGIIQQAIKIKRFLRDPFGKKNNKQRIDDIFKFNFEYKNDKNVTLIAGAMASFDKGVCNYLNLLSKKIDDSVFFLLSEANPNGTKDKVSFDSEMVPKFILKDEYKVGTNVKCPFYIKFHVRKTRYLYEAFTNLVKRHKDMEEAYACLSVYYMDKYIRSVVSRINIKRVILWNEFFAYHHIVKHVLNEYKIPVCFLEFGSVPGTLSIESMGQMGKSFPAQCIDEFKALEVNNDDIQASKQIIKYVYENRINRNIQPISSELEKVQNKLDPNRPTVLYAGVNDYESGLVPYNTETKKYHSPYARSSNEVVTYLSSLAEENGWNLIYKPHPSFFRHDNLTEKMPGNVILVNQVDINDIIDVADVVVTILSQVSYISLIREKATVMLGYTQLKGKECAYEAFKKGEIEKKIKEAINEGYTKHQKERFYVHIAQMLKYNLFYDYVNIDNKYGKSLMEAAEYIKNI